MSKESNMEKETKFGDEIIKTIEKHREGLTNIQVIGAITTVLLSAFTALIKE